MEMSTRLRSLVEHGLLYLFYVYVFVFVLSMLDIDVDVTSFD